MGAYICYTFLAILFVKTVHSATFYYFAYGSNLLAKRIHMNNPTAIFYGPAKLENYRLDFNGYFDNWAGACATIVPDPGNVVWGALWIMDVKDIPRLDKQELVDEKVYFAKNVSVTIPNGRQILARTYQETVNPKKTTKDLPWNRRPSNTYLQVIALGAIESRIPADYIGYIFSFPTNKLLAKPALRKYLGYPFY